MDHLPKSWFFRNGIVAFCYFDANSKFKGVVHSFSFWFPSDGFALFADRKRAESFKPTRGGHINFIGTIAESIVGLLYFPWERNLESFNFCGWRIVVIRIAVALFAIFSEKLMALKGEFF